MQAQPCSTNHKQLSQPWANQCYHPRVHTTWDITWSPKCSYNSASWLWRYSQIPLPEKDPSVQVPKRKQKLLTMKSATKKGKRKSIQMKKKRLITFCTKKAIAWAEQHEKGIECIGKQFIEQPRALVGTDGQPTKGDKSAMTSTLCSHYNSIIKSDYPPSWTPEIAILDGMFIINVKPLGKTFEDYSPKKICTTFLYSRSKWYPHDTWSIV